MSDFLCSTVTNYQRGVTISMDEHHHSTRMVEQGSLRIVFKRRAWALVLHLLSHFVRVENAWHRHLHFSLFLLCSLQGSLERKFSLEKFQEAFF